MASLIVTIVYGVLGLMLIIELGLTGYLVSVTDDLFSDNDTPSQFAFMLFCSIWSILVLIYLGLTMTVIKRMYLVSMIVVSLTALFWFAGSIAIAAFIGVPSCHGNNFCQCAQAGTAFGFFIWAVFTGLAVIECLGFFKGGANADVSRKPGQPYPGV